jgi:hypothetical protein
LRAAAPSLWLAAARTFPARDRRRSMRELHKEELTNVTGGGPGNSGPGDKNSRNERGHGGLPPSWAK